MEEYLADRLSKRRKNQKDEKCCPRHALALKKEDFCYNMIRESNVREHIDRKESDMDNYKVVAKLKPDLEEGEDKIDKSVSCTHISV